MKKFFTSFVLLLLMGVSAWAQTATVKVQGAPRKVAKAVANKVMFRAVTTATTDIDFDKIQRWAGTGDCRAALAIKWAGGMNDDKTLVWGYRWNNDEQKTGEDMLDAIAKADPQFYMIKQTGTAYGSAIGGFGFDTDNSGNITVVDPDGNQKEPVDGVVLTDDSNFDDYSAGDKNDAWNSGWYSGYWSYWVADATTDQLGYASTGATGRTLTDGCVDAWVWSTFSGDENNYDGNFNYLPAVNNTPEVDNTKGVFIVNEDWFGHRNSSVNHLADDGTWAYDYITDLGATACYGAFYGNRFYVMAKQAKDGAASAEGGRITICDAATMKKIKQIPVIDENVYNCDGRSFCGVDEHKAYVSTYHGIYVLDLDELEVKNAIEMYDAEGNAIDGNSRPQCGNMVRLNDYVYAVAQGQGILVIDANTDKVVATIECKNCGSIVMAQDGSLWVSTNSGISKINTLDNTVEAVSLADGTAAPSQSWYAWTPDGLCASLQQNALYWTSATGWFGADHVWKYDITTGESSLVLDTTTDPDKWNIYGCSFRVDPKTDNLYASFFKGFGEADYIVRKYDNKGNVLATYPMDDTCNPEPDYKGTAKNYWFPGMFVFPDTEAPVVADIDVVNVDEGQTANLDLTAYATDADNFQAGIVKTVENVADEAVATATIKNGVLVITGMGEGSTTVTVKFCSNGIATTKDINVTVSPETGISSANAADIREVARYTLDGKRIEKPQHGVNIVRYSDGSVKKVEVK